MEITRQLSDLPAARMLIGGKLVEAAGRRTMTTYDPATERALTEVPCADSGDVDLAVAAALDAFPAWRDLSTQARIGHLEKALRVLDENADELARLDSIDGGNPITAMRNDVALSRALLEPAMEWAPSLAGEIIPGRPDHHHYTVGEPFGVVARLIPYNHPLMFATRALVPLLVGNTVVLKTPDQTPLSGLRLGALLSDVFPAGVFNVLSGTGAEAGDALVRHPRVRRVVFTGSPATGMAIQRSAAEVSVKTVTLELGGKNPMLVLPDADPVAAAAGAVRGMNFHWTSGQSCGSTSRLLVHESLAEDVVGRVVEEMSKIRVGDPLDEETEMGPLVSAAQHAKVMSYIEGAVAEGGQILTGGGRPPGLEKGHFVAPTLVRADPKSRIAREEIFGPVLTVIPWRDEEDAISIANDVEYGLTASIWSADTAHAQRLARRLEAGYVWINTCSAHYPGVPFGGVKNSGVGREEHAGELRSYLQTKAVNLAL